MADGITGIRRLDDTIVRFGNFGGDNWHMSWASDDSQYTLLCDGQGYNTRLFKLAGNPPTPRFEEVPHYPKLLSEKAPNVNRYYGFGILAMDNSIYHCLSTPNHVFEQPDARFAGAKLIFSPDNGATWKNQDGSPVKWEGWQERSAANMVFFNEPGECFSLLTILQMGKNYALNQDGYVYVFSPNGSTEGTMNQLVMFRVPKGKLCDRGAYEFFVSRNADGSATWSKDIRERGVVHTFPAGWVNRKVHPYSWHPSVVYNAPLGVYMMANWGMGTRDGVDWFQKPTYLGFWIALKPWGPWRQIHEETEWKPGNPQARCYQPQIAPKWISEDGKSFWLVWTDWAGHYCFNMQKCEVLLK
ncbi:MAG: DUF4185 domain-containing protein [Planctomycetota bacterium]|nr:DUF4185 domain-containing protein [Planctomycetota bacterium]